MENNKWQKKSNFRLTRKKYICIIFIIIVISVILSKVFYENESAKITLEDLEIITSTEYSSYKYEYGILEKSFYDNFLVNGLVVTNLEELDDENLASGNDILSESIGLMLLKALKDNDENAFKDTVNNIELYFFNKNNLLKWKINMENTSDEAVVNASIDDLRVIKALFRAYEAWGNEIYLEKAINLGDNLYENCIENKSLLSYDDDDSPLAIWAYYDFQAMYYLSSYDDRWKIVIEEGIKSIKEKQVSNMPLYYMESNDEEYNSIENLITLMHLYEVGIKDQSSIKFIENELENGAYYAKYNKSGIAISDIESPAIYGIIAQIAKLDKNEKLYKLACEKMILFQHKENDKHFGGYIDEETNISYSFDHLMSLLGF
ncbi:MAG: hypothetical protein WBA54_00090 [Acidaminobacteraceae bacterium]